MSTPEAMDGLILCDKPAGMSSAAVVTRVRRTLQYHRVGHAGTLDPFATGLLLALVGRATRVQRFLLDLPKTYQVVARLGALSSTGDPEGDIVTTGRLPPDPPALPLGTVRQRPPRYSAIKIDGQRAYARARRGERFDVPERTVEVHRFEQLWRRGERAAFEIECSSGTYVRSLIAALGDAYCEQLRRIAIGPFAVGEASPPDWSGPGEVAILSLEQALGFLPQIRLQGSAARQAAHGAAVPAGATATPGVCLLLDADGPIAVARSEGEGEPLRVLVGFRSG